ncbi:hypothetical protein O181_048269 [Austropuccinia psidii MF-1]|uniref:Uncharacterized protein n=1 Tax=Austropuccinia psidii MF-1 TaxID=1389203 RepID=A0A9Q3HMT6_9BASI|nr:hypothetical protein [Austropuccinia psidii MF-1]
MVYKEKDWELLPKIYQGVINSCNNLKNFLKEEEMARYSNDLNPLSSKPQIKTIKDWQNKKREAGKEKATVASTRKPKYSQTPQEGKKRRKRTGGNHIQRVTGSQASKKDAMYNFFNRARTLMEFKEKEEQRMRKPHFPKK